MRFPLLTQRYRGTEKHRVLYETPKLSASVLKYRNVKIKLAFLSFFVSLFSLSYSQKVLDMNYYSIFGKEKTFQFFPRREFSYKLKGQLFCRTKTIANMTDSLIVFSDESIIRINQIKGVKIKGGNFSRYLFGSAALFPLLDIANNAAFDRRPLVNERALKVGGVFLALGLIVDYIQDKHIHIRKSTTFRVFDPDYEHLNAKR